MELYSVEQVAEMLGLHVKTVRNYIRDGRLKGVRVGKQYRIDSASLEAFLGHLVLGPPTEFRVEVTNIVQVDGVDQDTMYHLSTMLMATAKTADEPLRVETIYDKERRSVKIIIIGGLESSAELLKFVKVLLDSRQ